MTTIFHNPNCGTSRKTLGLLRERGVEPTVIEYLKTPPSREELTKLVAELGIPVRTLLRRKEAVYTELGLDDPKWSDAELIDFIAEHPILMERPVVVTPKGARLCRPAETVLELLD